MRIGKISIGDDQPCYLIAEAGVNHCGDLDIAKRMIEIAKYAGANAVKFQLYYPDKTISKFCPQAGYAARAGQRDSHKEMTAKLMFDGQDYWALLDHCIDVGIEFLCTPFDETAIDTLLDMDVNALKIPSGEINNYHYLTYAAQTGLPILLSTGMSTLAEVEMAVMTIEKYGSDLVLLHCVSDYPAPIEECNLRAMVTMKQAFGYEVGWSDHTLGNVAGVSAVTLGAKVIEKHFTYDKNLPGPDQQASCSPEELRAYIRAIRDAEACWGDGIKRVMPCEADTRNIARKSIVAARDIRAGARFRADDLTVKRPGTGYQPIMRNYLLGATAACDIPEDTLILPDMVRK